MKQATLSVHSLQHLHVGPVSVDFAPGSCTAITGSSGSGKSLLLRAIADLDPNQGDCALGVRSRANMPAPAWRRLVTFVASESGWWAPIVGDHFERHDDILADWVFRLGFPASALDWAVSRCSTGERQRLSLLRAVAQEPAFLLLDEPTSALDPEATASVEQLLLELMRAGTGIVLVTHEPAQIRRLDARHFKLDDGKLGEVVRDE